MKLDETELIVAKTIQFYRRKGSISWKASAIKDKDGVNYEMFSIGTEEDEGFGDVDNEGFIKTNLYPTLKSYITEPLSPEESEFQKKLIEEWLERSFEYEDLYDLYTILTMSFNEKLLK